MDAKKAADMISKRLPNYMQIEEAMRKEHRAKTISNKEGKTPKQKSLSMSGLKNMMNGANDNNSIRMMARAEMSKELYRGDMNTKKFLQNNHPNIKQMGNFDRKQDSGQKRQEEYKKQSQLSALKGSESLKVQQLRNAI